MTEDKGVSANEDAASNEQNKEVEQTENKKNTKIRKATNIILIVVSCLFVFHLVADRFIPSTDLGRIRG
ncbi:HlyD family secretion protein, partial [Shewanella sp. 0m-11]